MQFLKDQESIEVTTISDLMERFSYQPDMISKKDLMRIAEKICSSKQVVYDDVYSPSEVFAALSQSLHKYAQGGKMPAKLQREAPLGPMEMPPETAGAGVINLSM